MGSLWTIRSTLFRKQKKQIKKKKDLRNDKKTIHKKLGRLVFGEIQKKIRKKQKGKGLGALLIPLAKAVLSVFGSGKKKTW